MNEGRLSQRKGSPTTSALHQPMCRQRRGPGGPIWLRPVPRTPPDPPHPSTSPRQKNPHEQSGYRKKRTAASTSETRRGDLADNEDLFISIDSGENGQFNVKGRFDQFLDEIDNAQDLEDYANGSWI